MTAARGFNPPRFVRGGHAQTMLGLFFRRHLAWRLSSEDLIVESQPGIRVLARATWQEGDRSGSPALVLLHGMGGSDSSSYLLSMGLHAYAAGYHVIRMNMRGAGESFEICPRLYHAGLETDLVAMACRVARDVPRVGLFGASLGANHVLLAMGRSRSRLPAEVRAAVAISPPLDLMKSGEALDARQNRVYVAHFVERLRETYSRIQERSAGFYEAGREIGVRSVREFDEKITAPYAGFASADEYYTQSSSGPWLHAIDRPTLVISADDDPVIPGESVRGFALPQSGLVAQEILSTGGHVGFVAPTNAPGRFWAAGRALEFFNSHLSAVCAAEENGA